MADIDELKDFLTKANMPHADGSADMTKESDGSRTIVFADSDWSMNDNFYGGEPYGGRQVVFYKAQPVWMCVYYGWVDKDRECLQLFTRGTAISSKRYATSRCGKL